MKARIVLLVAIAALTVAGLLLAADNYLLRLATTVGMYAALALSWNLIGGYAGYPSFATAAFFGLGAYASGILQVGGLGFMWSWPLAGVLVATFAGLLGGAILHLRGHYFAIASLVVADVLRETTNTWTSLTGGGMGLNLPLLSLGSVDQQAIFYFAAMALMAIVAQLIAWKVDRARLGWALRCVEQNEDAALVIGVNAFRTKVLAFSLSGLIAGATGAVYASWVTYIDPTDVYDSLLSVKPILMAMIGGVGTVFGPTIGAFIFLFLEELLWRNVLEFHAGLLGALIVVMVLFLPSGMSRLYQFRWTRWPSFKLAQRGKESGS